jgi:hypothetical protein
MFILSRRAPATKRQITKREAEMVCHAILKRFQTSAAAREQILEQAQIDDAMDVFPTIPRTYAYLDAWQTELAYVHGKDLSKATFELEDSDLEMLNKLCQEPKHRCIVYSKSRPPSSEQQIQDLNDLHNILVIIQHMKERLSQP